MCAVIYRNDNCYASRAQKPHFCVKTTKNVGKLAHSDTRMPILCSKGRKMGVLKPKSAQKCRFCARRSTEPVQSGPARQGTITRNGTRPPGTKRNGPKHNETQPPRNEHNTTQHNATHATHATHATQLQRNATAQWGTTKKETTFRVVSFKNWRLPTLPHGSAVPSAQVSLTSLFGMGRGGSSPLLPP